MEDEQYDEMDYKIINFIKMINNKENTKKPEPKYFTISTQSAMCKIDGIKNIDLAKVVVYIAKNIIKNISLKENPDYLIRGIVVDNIIIRYDEVYLKKSKKPFIKYMGNIIDINNEAECIDILNNIQILENNSLKKHGRQKIKKENEYFYNSCSIIVKASKEIKPVNIKLFNNGQITLTGAKNESDGYYSCCVLLDEMRKNVDNFPDLKIEDEIDEKKTDETTPLQETLLEEKLMNLSKTNTDKLKEIDDILINLKIINYEITMINSDFNCNFKIDLIKLLNILNTNEKDLFTKFNPEKYRGLIIGYYWNTTKKNQDGRCLCKVKCNGKGCGTGEGKCKKITIAIFKSGSIIITGGRLIKQVEDSYKSINNLFDKYYHEIIKLSILDFIDDINNEDIDYNDNKVNINEIRNNSKPIKIKKNLEKSTLSENTKIKSLNKSLEKEVSSEIVINKNTMNLSKQSGDKEIVSGEKSSKVNTMNLSKQSGDKELLSGTKVEENKELKVIKIKINKNK
jgi:TATA-box binding protein (TBP) (component of TFIID and TFIIIB)